MGMKVMKILLVAACLMLIPGAALAVNGTNGIDVNGDLKIIVTDPDDCPEGTVAVPLEAINGSLPVDARLNDNDIQIIELYECVPEVPETPLVPETPTAVAEDAYPAETAAARTQLPSTGLVLLAPVAGLGIAAAGLRLLRRRS